MCRAIADVNYADAGSTGVVTVCQGVVKTYQQLVVCRFLLGLFEAGFVPGEPFRLCTASNRNRSY
jgi:hypothetical protein